MVFSCDGCSAEEELDPNEDFKDAWAGLKAAGWRAYKDGDQWVHKCSDCMRKWRPPPPHETG